VKREITGLLWILLASSTASCSSANSPAPAEPVIVEPATRIDIERVNNELVFRFGLCKEGDVGIATSYVSVADEKHILCQVEREADGPLVESWHYGSSENGFQKKRCEPLSPSGRYTICSMGGGGGCSQFELTADGTPHLLKNACGFQK